MSLTSIGGFSHSRYAFCRFHCADLGSRVRSKCQNSFAINSRISKYARLDEYQRILLLATIIGCNILPTQTIPRTHMKGLHGLPLVSLEPHMVIHPSLGDEVVGLLETPG